MVSTQELWNEFVRKSLAACDYHANDQLTVDEFSEACYANQRVRSSLCEAIRALDALLD